MDKRLLFFQFVNIYCGICLLAGKDNGVIILSNLIGTIQDKGPVKISVPVAGIFKSYLVAA